MQLKTNCHIVVADSEKYLLLRNQGDEVMLDLRVVDHKVDDNPSTRNQGTDRPGRMSNPNNKRSAVANTDWHKLQKQEAANALADRINELALTDSIGKLILIADTKTLGGVRPKLSEFAQTRIMAEIPKDLIHHTIEHIEKIIQTA